MNCEVSWWERDGEEEEEEFIQNLAHTRGAIPNEMGWEQPAVAQRQEEDEDE